MSGDGFVDYDFDDDDEYEEGSEVYENENVADDLATYVIPSPIWYNEAYESDETDDSSDGYFDQDPPPRQVRGPLQESPGVPKGIEELKRSPKLPRRSRPIDKSNHGPSIGGTVWKISNPTCKVEYVQPGHSRKVALLQDWREVFRGSRPESERLKEERLQNMENGQLKNAENEHSIQSVQSHPLTCTRAKRATVGVARRTDQSAPDDGVELHGQYREDEGDIQDREFGPEESNGLANRTRGKRKATNEDEQSAPATKRFATNKAKERPSSLSTRALRSRRKEES